MKKHEKTHHNDCLNIPESPGCDRSIFCKPGDLSFDVKITFKINSKFLTNALGSVLWSSNNIGNRSLNCSLWFLEPMIVNSVLLGFSFSFEFVIQVKTSVTQDIKSVRDSKVSEPDRDIYICVSSACSTSGLKILIVGFRLVVKNRTG